MKNGNSDSRRNSFNSYYTPLVEIKYYDVLIDNKSSCDEPVESKQEAHETLVKMSRNNDYATGNLLDYLYHQNCYQTCHHSGSVNPEKNIISKQD